jgi:hypothetical protein
MPVYEIQEYELHSSKTRVTADTLPQAIQKLRAGEGTPVDNSTEFIEGDDTRGMPDYDFEEADMPELVELELFDVNGRIAGIRSIVEVEV